MYDAVGKKILIRLSKALKKYQEKMTDEEFANMLLKKYIRL